MSSWDVFNERRCPDGDDVVCYDDYSSSINDLYIGIAVVCCMYRFLFILPQMPYPAAANLVPRFPASVVLGVHVPVAVDKTRHGLDIAQQLRLVPPCEAPLAHLCRAT
jgi:hypothetical protein